MDDNAYKTPSTQMDSGSSGPGTFGRFDFGKGISDGLAAFKENIGPGIGLSILLSLLSVLALCTGLGYFFLVPQLSVGFAFMGLYMIRKRLETKTIFLGFRRYGGVLIVFLVTFLISTIFSAPQYIIASQKMGDITGKNFQEAYMAFALALSEAGIIWSLIGWIGTLIIIYISVRIMLYAPLLVERNMSVEEAIKSSISATAPDQWALLGYFLVVSLISMSGIIICGIGIIVTIPLGVAMYGSALHQLLGEG
jgi:membrane-anchored glycerophosphoryl diester phosphodiesterase (GDPDase)